MKRGVAISFVLFLSAAAFCTAQPSGLPFVAVIRLTGPLNPLTVRFLGSAVDEAQKAGAGRILLETSASGGYSSSAARALQILEDTHVPLTVRSSAGAGRSKDPFLDYLERNGIAAASSSSVANLAAPSAQPVRVFEMSGIARLISPLLDSNLAYVLLLLGIIGIAVEFSLPGIGLPGVLGGLSLLVSLVSLGALSVNIGGLLLIFLSLVLFIVDIKAPTHGILTAGGIVSLIVGSFFLFPSRDTMPGFEALRVSPIAIGTMTAALSAILVSAVVIGARAQKRKVEVGSQTLIGLSGMALTDMNPGGLVRVGNEEWSATSVGDEIRAGDEVDVVDVKGVHLVIMRRL